MLAFTCTSNDIVKLLFAGLGEEIILLLDLSQQNIYYNQNKPGSNQKLNGFERVNRIFISGWDCIAKTIQPLTI